MRKIALHRYSDYRWLRGFKPMLCNECIPGGLDDLRRAECARWSIAALEEVGYGWMGWGMREGKAVSTRRDRYDGNGLDNQGFHAWFHADGSLRAGLEFLREPISRNAPWGKGVRVISGEMEQ